MGCVSLYFAIRYIWRDFLKSLPILEYTVNYCAHRQACLFLGIRKLGETLLVKGIKSEVMRQTVIWIMLNKNGLSL